MDKNIDELIIRYLSDEATHTEIEELNHWLAEDESHLRQFFYLKNLHDAWQPAFDPAAVDERAAYRKICRRLDVRPRVQLRWKPLTAVAIIVLAVLITAVFRNVFRETLQPSQIIPPLFTQSPSALLTLPSGEAIVLDGQSGMDVMSNRTAVARVDSNCIQYTAPDIAEDKTAIHQLSVPRGGEFFLTLSDGTRIWINADSRVRYPVEFTGNERKIYIEGEAYLEVAHDTVRPFRVMMPQNEVTVLGTTFNVNAYPEEEHSFITLVSGSVRVQSSSGGEGLTLVPGEQAVVGQKNGQMIKRSIDPSVYCGWHYGRIVFHNNSLEEILNRLARWYDIRIEWEDATLKEMRFSGEIKKYGQVEKLLEMISRTEDVQFVIHGRNIIVMKP